MSLKQNFGQNTAIIYNILRSFEHEKHHTFPSGLVAHQDDKVLFLSDVLGLLDEATNQIRKLLEEIKQSQIKESCVFEFQGETIEFDKSERFGVIVALQLSLAVLEGENK